MPPTGAHIPRLLTLAEAAEVLGGCISHRTLRREVERGHLQARRIGRCLRVTEDELARWVYFGAPEQKGE